MIKAKNNRGVTFVVSVKQLRFIISVVLLNLFAFAIIFTSLYYISRNVNEHIEHAVIELNHSSDIDDDIIKGFTEFARTLTNDTYDLSSMKVLDDHAKSKSIIHTHIDELTQFATHNKYLLIFIAAVQIIQVILLTVYMYRKTKKIYLAEAVLAKMIKQISSNRKVPSESSEKCNELKSLYNEIYVLAKKRGLLTSNEKKSKNK